MPKGDAALSVVLAEYQALRAEIDRRSQAHQTLSTLALTLTGALIAYAVAHESVHVLLVQPVVVSALGLLYADHAVMIRRLSRYLDRRVAPLASELVGQPRVMSWEGLAVRRARAWHVIGRTPPRLIFLWSPALVLLTAPFVRVFPTITRGSALLAVPRVATILLWLFGGVCVLAATSAFYGAYHDEALTQFDAMLDGLSADEALDSRQRDREPGRAV